MPRLRRLAMKSVRTAVAAAAPAIAVVPVTLAGCGRQPATPATMPSSTPTATAPVSPATTPAPTQTPGPGATSPAPSIRVISSPARLRVALAERAGQARPGRAQLPGAADARARPDQRGLPPRGARTAAV